MRKTFHNVYVGDIVYILHNGGSMSEAKIIREKTNFLIADNLESIDWEVLIKKAMKE